MNKFYAKNYVEYFELTDSVGTCDNKQRTEVCKLGQNELRSFFSDGI